LSVVRFHDRQAMKCRFPYKFVACIMQAGFKPVL